MKTPHQHDFSSIKVVDVIADNKRYSIEKSGVWAFLIRYCNCGMEEPQDFLKRDQAYSKLELIMERG